MGDEVVPDHRIQLPTLSDEWGECTACTLGESRHQVGGAFVFGEGTLGGVMFIGEGPGKDEETAGKPFVGATGQFLRDMLKELEFDNYYLTNSVCCRSWDYAYDNNGNRLVRKNWHTKKEEFVVKDQAPTPPQMLACRPRLMQQIYLVDPVLIVTLGGSAGEAVIGKPVKVLTESGKLTQAGVPGAGAIPSLTPKGSWARKTGPKGNRTLIAPIMQNRVMYPVIPLVHPAYAWANKKDRRPGSPMNLFVSGLQKARNIYSAYRQETEGGYAVEYELTDDAVSRALDEEGYIGSEFN